MNVAANFLGHLGHRHVAKYMWALTEIVVDARLMVTRLHNEKKVWAATDRRIQTQAVQAAQPGLVAMQATIVAYHDARDTNGLIESTDVFLHTYVKQARAFLGVADEIHRIIVLECPYIQFLILGFLKQNRRTRLMLRPRYMDILAWRLQNVLLRMVDDVANAIALIYDQWARERNARHPQNLHLIIKGASDFNDMALEVRNKLHATRQALVDIHDLLASCISNPGLQPEASRDRFQMLTAASGLGQIGDDMKGPPLRNLALRDMRNMAVGDPARLRVGRWLNLLWKVKGMEEATRPGRDAIRRDVNETFSVPAAAIPALTPPNIRPRRPRRPRREGFTVAGFETFVPGLRPTGQAEIVNEWVSGVPGSIQVPLDQQYQLP